MPDDSPKLAAWEQITGNDAPDADLCAACADRKARGVLAEPLTLECARCGQSSGDSVAHCWRVRSNDGRMIDACNACATDDDVTDVI